MKDIDFDELDKAVNSLMATGGPANDTSNTSEPEETIVTIPSTIPSSSKAPAATQFSPVSQKTEPVVSPPVSSAPTPVAVTSKPSVPPAVRRGRFMDMVQPQSSQNRQSATPAPSREGLSIAPRGNSTTPVVAQPAAVVAPSQPVESPVGTVPTLVSTPESTTSSYDTMPDPIDTMQDDTTVTPSDSVDPQYDSLSAASTESPFLTDAKVEKRPLNSNLGLELEEAAKEEATEADVTAPIESSRDEEADADEPPIYPTAPELSGDLVAIESGQAIETTQTSDTTATESQVEAPAPPLGATSIAQQYKAKESSGDQSHAAIYDAAHYPEPLSHPAKSKSGWLWVLWVIVLLGIGAGGAVLLYVLGIIP